MTEDSPGKKQPRSAPEGRPMASVRTRMLAGAVSAMLVFAVAVMLISYLSAFRFKSAAAPQPVNERGRMVDIADIPAGGYRYVDVPQERPLAVSYRWLILRAADGSVSVLWLPQRNGRLLMPAAVSAGELAMFGGECLEFLPLRADVIGCADSRLPVNSAENWQWNFAGKSLLGRSKAIALAPFNQVGDKVWLLEP